LLSVVEELRHEQLIDLVGHRILELSSTIRAGQPSPILQTTHHWVICQIWRGLICRRRGGRALPAGNIDRVKVFSHLRDHRWLEAAIGVTGSFVLQPRVLISALAK
jgi:hypothetical protein